MSDDIDAYYSRSMFEDPWKDLLPQGEQTEEAAAPPTVSDNTTTTQDGAATDNNHEQEMAASTVDASAGKTDTDNRSEISPPSMESCPSADISTNGGCVGTGNEAGVQSQDSVLAGVNDSTPRCIQEGCHSTVVMDNADDTSNKAEDSGDHLCVTNTNQESLQIEESTSTEIQD